MRLPAASQTARQALDAAGILDLWDKLAAGERLSHADGLRLFETPDVTAVGWMADQVRRDLHGDRCWFNRNLHINATNVCEASCIFCSFARLETGDPNAWTIVDDRLYLNHTLQVRERWKTDIPGNIAAADGNWPGVLD